MEISIKELEKRLKDRIVGDVLERMIIDIDLMPPNGTNIHDRCSYRVGLRYCLDNRKEQKLHDKTFGYHKKKNKELYEMAIRGIKEAMEHLNLTV